MRVSGFENIAGPIGNLAGINMSGFDINKRPGALGGRAGEQPKGIYEGGTQQNQQLNEELKNRGIMPRGVNLPLVQGGPAPLENAGFFEGQNINTFQNTFSNPFLAENQGPSTPVKYYPDANKGQGGYLPNRGAGYPANVRPKGQQFLAQSFPGGQNIGNVGGLAYLENPFNPADYRSPARGVQVDPNKLNLEEYRLDDVDYYAPEEPLERLKFLLSPRGPLASTPANFTNKTVS